MHRFPHLQNNFPFNTMLIKQTTELYGGGVCILVYNSGYRDKYTQSSTYICARAHTRISHAVENLLFISPPAAAAQILGQEFCSIPLCQIFLHWFSILTTMTWNLGILFFFSVMVIITHHEFLVNQENSELLSNVMFCNLGVFKAIKWRLFENKLSLEPD